MDRIVLSVSCDRSVAGGDLLTCQNRYLVFRQLGTTY